MFSSQCAYFKIPIWATSGKTPNELQYMNTLLLNLLLKSFRNTWKRILYINNKNIGNKHFPDTERSEGSASSIPTDSLTCSLWPSVLLALTYLGHFLYLASWKLILASIAFLHFNVQTNINIFPLMTYWILCIRTWNIWATQKYSPLFSVFFFALLVSARSWLCKLTGKGNFVEALWKHRCFFSWVFSFWRWSKEHTPMHEVHQKPWLFLYTISIISLTSHGL